VVWLGDSFGSHADGSHADGRNADRSHAVTFLGAGIPRLTPSWGLMVAGGRDRTVTARWVSFFPGMAIPVTVPSRSLHGPFHEISRGPAAGPLWAHSQSRHQ
jgi:hypothetical protein